MPARVEIDGHSLTVDEPLSLFECAERLEVRVPTSCRKNGRCRECLVEVDAGAERLTPPSASEAHLARPFRLACCARLEESVSTGAPDREITIRCRTLRRGALRIVDAGLGGHLAVFGDDAIDPAFTRQGDDVLLEGRRVDRYRGAIRGLAIDVGTTSVVLRLVDLESGRIERSSSFENPQRFGGSDVMARIQYDREHPDRLLQRTLLAYLAHEIEALDVDPETIYEALVVGNSTMRDLFFGLDVSSIGERPYRSLTEHELHAGSRASTALNATPRKLRLSMSLHGRVTSLPLLAGHVGADTAACVLAIDLLREERLVALMDIGTNTELVVGNRHRALVASCPAGPAFEGGAITCGMPGVEGAIESVLIDGDTVRHRTIGDVPPIGICGSGLIETLGELARTGRMDEYGRLADDAERFVVDAARGLHVSEADISELAQAKGAQVAGLAIVLDRYGASKDELECFHLAGGFAKHLPLAAARRIGLVPDLPEERFVSLGNAAIEGATIALLSVSRRDAVDAFARRLEHVELETDPNFFDRFVDGCLFRPFRAEPGGVV